MANNTRIMTGKVRLSYVNLFKPRAAMEGQEEKYSCTLLIPKTDIKTLNAIKEAIKNAIENGKNGAWGGKVPPKVVDPLHDGDGIRESDGEEFGPECKGHWVMTASAKKEYAPGIVDVRAQPITDQSEVYSGMYARISVNFFPYMFGGKKGIGCGLGNVQKLADGEPLAAAGIKAEDEFTPLEVDPITGDPIL